MRYTLRNVPKAVDRALRQRARRENKSLNEVAIEALSQGVGLEAPCPAPSARRPRRYMVRGPEFDAAIADQHRIDPELWR